MEKSFGELFIHISIPIPDGFVPNLPSFSSALGPLTSSKLSLQPPKLRFRGQHPEIAPPKTPYESIALYIPDLVSDVFPVNVTLE